MNIVIMGAQGTGKGTVAGILKTFLMIPHISTGEMFRKNIKAKTELGKTVAKYTNSGILVPDEITNEMIKTRINELDCQKGFILDGYPRTLDQAKELDKMLEEKGEKLDLVIYLTTPMDEIIERVMARRECPNCRRVYNMILNKPRIEERCDLCGIKLVKRRDDTEENLKKRLDIFFEQTEPVKSFYEEKGIVKEEEVSSRSNRLGEDVAKDILRELKKTKSN